MDRIKSNFRLSASLLFVMTLSILASCLNDSGNRIDGTVRDEAYEGKTVYLCETYHQTAVDSTTVRDASFRFSIDSLEPDVYLLKLMSSSDDMFPITLPVVAEKGRIQVALGEIVYTSGTPLNDVAQDFLLAIDRYSDQMHQSADKPATEMRAGFSKLLVGFILQNKDNCLGPYIYRSYSTRLTPEDLAAIEEKAGKKFMENINYQ